MGGGAAPSPPNPSSFCFFIISTYPSRSLPIRSLYFLFTLTMTWQALRPPPQPPSSFFNIISTYPMKSVPIEKNYQYLKKKHTTPFLAQTISSPSGSLSNLLCRVSIITSRNAARQPRGKSPKCGAYSKLSEGFHRNTRTKPKVHVDANSPKLTIFTSKQTFSTKGS